MTAGDRFDPGAARRAMDRSEVDYNDVAADVRAALQAAVSAQTTGNAADHYLAELLKSMHETHQSIRSVYSSADNLERSTGEKTGRWMDAVLLARAQYDAAFVGLLLAHDEKQWVRKYQRAGWAANAIRCVYSLRRLSATPAGRVEARRVLGHLRAHAKHLGLTKREWTATLAEVRGAQLPHRGADRKDVVSPLPTPGQIVMRSLLAGGPYERLGQLLWQQWKLLCDPAHIGIGVLVNKSGLRDDRDLDRPRDRFIAGEVIHRSIVPSFAAMMTVVTIVATRHPGNIDLMARTVKGWRVLEGGTFEGGIIWDGWAKSALRVLDDD